MKKLLGSIAVCGLAAFAASAAIAAPGSGEITKYFHHPNQSLSFLGDDCIEAYITVRWNLSSLFGDPVKNGTWKFETSDDDCEPKFSPVIWLNLISNIYTEGWVNIDPLMPSKRNEWGLNVAGSPSWDKAVCNRLSWEGIGETEFERRWSGDYVAKCLRFWPPSQAKEIWKTGEVTSFRVSIENRSTPQEDESPAEESLPKESWHWSGGRGDFKEGEKLYGGAAQRVLDVACGRARDAAKKNGTIVPYAIGDVAAYGVEVSEYYDIERGLETANDPKGLFDGCHCEFDRGFPHEIYCEIKYFR